VTTRVDVKTRCSWSASNPLMVAYHDREWGVPLHNDRKLFELLVLADLRRRGFSVHQLHAILDVLKDRFATRLFDATGGGGSVRLLTDGREIYAKTARGELYNLLRTPMQPLLVIGDEGLLKDLSGKVRGRKRRKRTLNQS